MTPLHCQRQSGHIVSVLGLTVAQLERHLFGETHRPQLPSRIVFLLSQQSRLLSDAAARGSQSEERVNLGCSLKHHKVGSVILFSREDETFKAEVGQG